MPAPNIAAATRYFAIGTTRIVFCPTVSVLTAPSRAEINAGTDLSNEVVDTSGWTISANLLDAPDIGHIFNGKVSGRTSAEDSSLTMYASLTTADIRAAMPRGTTGVMLIMWGGDVTGRKMDVYPVTVASVGKSIPDNKAADMKISFAITSQPAEDVTIPA